jgi:uncharacterized protein with NRDE domain
LCLIVIAWKARVDLPLIVAANRDEWRERPAQPAHWWNDERAILAGRDLRAGGTWMGVTRSGRFAAITNFRDPAERRSTAPSRGALVTEYLLSGDPPERFLTSIAARAAAYNGFNLIAGDGASLWYYASREDAMRPVEPGVHGLSNHLLDEPWPKVRRGRAVMEEALRDADPAPRLFRMLSDANPAADAELPETGVGITWERRLATALITGEDYGTRCSTVVTFAASGAIGFDERTRIADGSVTTRAEHRFRIESLGAAA